MCSLRHLNTQRDISFFTVGVKYYCYSLGIIEYFPGVCYSIFVDKPECSQGVNGEDALC